MSLSCGSKELFLTFSTARCSEVVFLNWEDLCLNVHVNIRGLACGIFGALLRDPESVSPRPALVEDHQPSGKFGILPT